MKIYRSPRPSSSPHGRPENRQAPSRKPQRGNWKVGIREKRKRARSSPADGGRARSITSYPGIGPIDLFRLVRPDPVELMRPPVKQKREREVCEQRKNRRSFHEFVRSSAVGSLVFSPSAIPSVWELVEVLSFCQQTLPFCYDYPGCFPQTTSTQRRRKNSRNIRTTPKHIYGTGVSHSRLWPKNGSGIIESRTKASPRTEMSYRVSGGQAQMPMDLLKRWWMQPNSSYQWHHQTKRRDFVILSLPENGELGPTPRFVNFERLFRRLD